MTWKLKKFEDCTVDELYHILQARECVFVIEQQCLYCDLDGKDQAAIHLFKQQGEDVIAYARIFPSGTVYPQASFGRVLVQKNCRSQGIARELISQVMHFLQSDLQESVIKIQAQAYLQDFYAAFGFRAISEVYLEDNIPHIDMIWEK